MHDLKLRERSLAILLLEDYPDDAELVIRELKQGQIACTCRCVSLRSEFIAALSEFQPDLILSDYQLPEFSGVEALQMARERYPDLPFILVTGALGEEVAVDTLKHGATDYILKTRLSQLVPAVLRAIRETEERLKRRFAEAKYRSIFENAIEGIFQTTPDGRFLSANPALARMLGYESAEELIGSVSDLGQQMCVHPESRLELKRRLETDGYVQDFENLVRRKDGTPIWISVNARLVRDRAGEILYYEGTSEDVTPRKEAERQVATLAHAVESTGEMICITDLSDRFTFVNRSFQENYGYTSAEILGKNPALLFSKRNSPELMAEILEHTRRGGWRGEVIDVRKDGTEFPVFLSTSQIKDPAGRVIGLMGVAQDITQRKRAEEQIQLLADAVQSAHELISITNSENRITFVNKAFLRTYGYSEKEILGRTPEFLYSDSNPAGLCAQVFAKTMDGSWSGEIINRRKDGTDLPILLSASPIKSSRGDILGLVGVARDISERKRAERQNAAFSALGHRLSSATTAEQAARIILEIAHELFGWDAGYVHLYSKEQDRIVPVLTMDTVDNQRIAVEPTTFTLDPSPLMRLIMEQGARLVNRRKKDLPRVNLVSFGNTNRPSASMVYVPIHSSGLVVGILSIQSYTPDAYSEADLVLLQALADHCGGAFQRIQVADALRESEDRFRTLVESAPIGIALHDAKGHFVHTNTAYQQMLGYTDEELRKLGVKRITYKDDVKDGQQLFTDLLEGTRDAYYREKRYVHKEGRLVWAQSSASAIRSSSGKLIYVISMVEDISEQKAVMEALRQSERKLRLIAENTSDVIFAFDMERQPFYVNPAVKDVTGYTFNEIKDRKFINWIHPEDEARMLKHWEELFAGKSYSEVEFRLVTKSGEIKWCSSSWGPLLDEQGKQIGVQGRERDISERKQLEKEVLESTTNERRRIGHDLHDGLGQYLAGIAFRAKALEQVLARKQSPDASEAGELATLISNAISQTRSLARGLDPIEVEAVGLPAALQNLAADTRKFFEVNCSFRCSETIPVVEPQAALVLYRIVQEAIHNAITHGGAGQIDIDLEGGHSLNLKIRDNGSGFTLGRKTNGGMGLRVMEYRAHSLGGKLTIDTREGRGTEVICTVPRSTNKPMDGAAVR